MSTKVGYVGTSGGLILSHAPKPAFIQRVYSVFLLFITLRQFRIAAKPQGAQMAEMWPKLGNSHAPLQKWLSLGLAERCGLAKGPSDHEEFRSFRELLSRKRRTKKRVVSRFYEEIIFSLRSFAMRFSTKPL
jgi:hypothetical protein